MIFPFYRKVETQLHVERALKYFKLVHNIGEMSDLFDSHVRAISLIRQLASSDWRATVANATKLYDRITSAIVSRKQENQLLRSPFADIVSLILAWAFHEKISPQLIPFHTNRFGPNRNNFALFIVGACKTILQCLPKRRPINFGGRHISLW